jgi:hypothetical protein
MAVLTAIETILSDDRLDVDACDEDACDGSKCERIERLIASEGWEPARDSMLDLLAAERRVRDYQVAAEVLWGTVVDGRELPTDRLGGTRIRCATGREFDEHNISVTGGIVEFSASAEV